MAGLVIRALALMLAMAAAPLWAADPTRPPEPWLAGEATAPVTGFRLQSVLLPQRGRPVAVINGRMVLVGEEIDGRQLLRISERDVLLKGDDGLLQVFLTPDVEKQMITHPRRPSRRSGQSKDAP